MSIGILVTHGTDTLAWTHAFLRYAIKNNHANIVLTGSQIPIPIKGEFSDAYMNLESSLRLMTQVKPPQLLAVFNYGEDVFSDSLRKIDRWGNVAFAGDRIARMEWGEVRPYDRSLERMPAHRLERLYLVATGGTIDALRNDDGILVAGENRVGSYLMDKFATHFEDVSQDPVFAIDSSDLTLERMKSIATKVVACLQETNPSADVDLAFDPDVNICYLDPLKGLKHLQSETREASAVVLAGYGGGNILLNDGHGMGFLPLVTDLTRQQKPVVLSSQVPLGVADFVYENGVKAIEAGAIPGVDLSLPECQIRMSYLLGHRSEIERASADSGVAYMKILEVLFVSGMKFRNAQSRSLYEKAKRLPVIEEDLLTSYSREEALRQILERLRHTS